MKNILITVLLILASTIYSQTLTFEPASFSTVEQDARTLKKEFNLYQRTFDPQIDENFMIQKIDMIPGTTRATIEFFGTKYDAKYYIYPDTDQTIYLFKFKGLDNFSITLTRDSGKIRYLYMIPNRGLFSKTSLRDMPLEDREYLQNNNFDSDDIERVVSNGKFTIFYTGFVTFN
jgi:hypothetical protein